MTPKATLKPEKKDFVLNLANSLKKSNSITFVDYSGMGVKMQQDLKKRLKEVGGKMLVAKNTLIRLAGKNISLPKEALEDEILSGQTAVVLAEEDSVAPIQTLGKFMEEFELPRFKAGIIEGLFQKKESLITISKLPNKATLTNQVYGAIAAPLYSLLNSLQGNLSNLVFTLQEAQKKGGD